MPFEIITEDVIKGFEAYLVCEEKSAATVEKYARYAKAFAAFVGGALTRQAVVAFKDHVSSSYTAAGANGMLAAVNSLLGFLGLGNLRVKSLKVQRKVFRSPGLALDRADLNRLLTAAQRSGKHRTALVMETLVSTGIRVSELRFITVEALLVGRAEIRLKGKTRTVLLPTKLCRKLAEYARARGAQVGSVFVTRSGNPLDRSNVWSEMKRLCQNARVITTKVFPHNLRHLFAQMYYKKMPNLVELADIMGHSDVNTTRIYTATTGAEYRRRLDALGLVL